MELDEYERMYRLESDYWWYVGMRALQAEFLADAPLRDARILDAGCGTGANLAWLAGHGRPVGVDLYLEALLFCRRRGLRRLGQGSITALPIRSASVDLATCFDVLVHRSVAEDGAGLRELYRVLAPGGRLLCRVAAYDWLRGSHDRIVHTRHRYRRRELRQKLEQAGFAVERLSYVNTLLFAPIAVRRVAERMWRRAEGDSGSDLHPVSSRLNRFLERALRAEAWWLGRGRSLPFGLSVMALARKR